MTFDYAVHSDYLIHWTGRDIEGDSKWRETHQSKTNDVAEAAYLDRLYNILRHGLWMTEEADCEVCPGVTIPATPKCCFTELKLSESRRHAGQYGRLGIGVKRPFVFDRFGRPLAYFGFNTITNDKFLRACANE